MSTDGYYRREVLINKAFETACQIFDRLKEKLDDKDISINEIKEATGIHLTMMRVIDRDYGELKIRYAEDYS